MAELPEVCVWADDLYDQKPISEAQFNAGLSGCDWTSEVLNQVLYAISADLKQLTDCVPFLPVGEDGQFLSIVDGELVWIDQDFKDISDSYSSSSPDQNITPTIDILNAASPTLDNVNVWVERYGEMATVSVNATFVDLVDASGNPIQIPSDEDTQITFDLAEIGGLTGTFSEACNFAYGDGTIQFNDQNGALDSALSPLRVAIQPPTSANSPNQAVVFVPQVSFGTLTPNDPLSDVTTATVRFNATFRVKD